MTYRRLEGVGIEVRRMKERRRRGQRELLPKITILVFMRVATGDGF